MLYELGRFFLLSIHHKITKTLQGALFLSNDAENHRSSAYGGIGSHILSKTDLFLCKSNENQNHFVFLILGYLAHMRS